MDREERLRRRREQARLRRAAETPEQREARLARRRQYDRARRAALTREQREAMNQVRRTAHQINNPPQVARNDFRNCTIDDERITDKIKEFHRKLFAIEAVLCCVCLERFPTIETDDGGVCTRCRADSKTPKIYSAGNNMDPGPVPPELSVSF